MNHSVFKIKNAAGKFSTGGCAPNWTSRGKAWTSLGYIKAHLRQFIHEIKYKNVYSNEIPEDWVVVQYTGESVKEFSARELFPSSGLMNALKL